MLEGIFPALITPFKSEGEINVEGLKRLINFVIAKGVAGVVPVGTTGEFIYMLEEERNQVLEIVVDEVNSRVPVIAGTGSSSTAETIKLSKYAENIGVDALLVVSPYRFNGK